MPATSSSASGYRRTVSFFERRIADEDGDDALEQSLSDVVPRSIHLGGVVPVEVLLDASDVDDDEPLPRWDLSRAIRGRLGVRDPEPEAKADG